MNDKSIILDDSHPIFQLCENGDLKAVEEYFQQGVSPYSESEHNPSLVGIAAFHENRDLIELMLRHGLDINHPHNRFGSSVAEFAIHKDSVGWLDYFLQLGVPVDAADKYGSTLLGLAAGGGKINCLKFLLGKGAIIEKSHYLGGTPFCHAAWNNQIAAMQLLWDHGADLDVRDFSKTTPLIGCAKGGKLEAVEWLLNHGADIHAKDERGKTALDWAVANGHHRIVDLLQARIAC